MIRIPRIRKAGVAALTGLTAVAGLAAMAPPAHAAVDSATVTASAQPAIYPTLNDQPAGDWNVTTGTGTFLVGEQFVLSVGDSDGAATNCLITGDTVGFGSTVPTVTINTPASGQATFAVSTTSTGAACATAGVKNTLILTVTASGTATDFDITGITYNVGAAVTPGPVDVINGGVGGGPNTAATTVDVTDASNALISPVQVTANNPPVAIDPGSSGSAISPVTIQEFQPNVVGADPDTFVCLSLTDVTFTHDGSDIGDVTFSGTPTITATGGGAQASDIVVGTDPDNPADNSPFITFEVTHTSGTAPGKWVIGGITVDTPNGNDFGEVSATVSAGDDRTDACDSGEISPGIPDQTVVITSIIGVSRLQGSNRFATARAIAEDTNECSDIVLLARGDLFADALAGSYLAGFNGYAPILLSGVNALPADTIQAMRELGAQQVIMLGQTAALSASVQNTLSNTPSYECGGSDQRSGPEGGIQKLEVTRVGGADRFETAKLVSEEPGLAEAGTADYDGDASPNAKRTAIVASGVNFPDALAAAPMAAAGSANPIGGFSNNSGFPLLLTGPGALSPAAEQGLVDLNIQQVLIPGGTVAVSAAVESAITGMGITVKRFAGADRAETAALVADFEVAKCSNPDPAGTNQPVPFFYQCFNGDSQQTGLWWNTQHVNVARGDDFADALAGGPHAGQESSPILLTLNPSTIGTATQTWLNTHRVTSGTFSPPVGNTGGISFAHLLGGPAAITPATETAIRNTLTSGS